MAMFWQKNKAPPIVQQPVGVAQTNTLVEIPELDDLSDEKERLSDVKPLPTVENETEMMQGSKEFANQVGNQSPVPVETQADNYEVVADEPSEDNEFDKQIAMLQAKKKEAAEKKRLEEERKQRELEMQQSQSSESLGANPQLGQILASFEARLTKIEATLFRSLN